MQMFGLTPSPNPLSKATIVDNEYEVVVRLKQLHAGLTIALFRTAIIGGLEGRNEITNASAAIASGVQQWLKTVEMLRTVLAAEQWHCLLYTSDAADE